MRFSVSALNFIFVLVIVLQEAPLFECGHDYGEALTKAILFYQGQRSGKLPKYQNMTWRGDSALDDGKDVMADLVGGYYDAGDNIKFGFPLAFTTTMLAWSVIEFRDLMPPKDLREALVAIKWATDYLLKTVAQLPNKFFVQVGDPIKDHNCWERPEDMDTSRKTYVINANEPASDIAGEYAAALAASSMAFKSSDPGYSETLLRNAQAAFEYADKYRGAYTESPSVNNGSCPYYCDFSGYQDELLWGAAWLGKATGIASYVNYIHDNAITLGAGEGFEEFGWDNKHGGINVLASKESLQGVTALESYKKLADSFMCTIISNSTPPHIDRTPAGLIYKEGGSNLQHVTSIAFLLLTYAKYLDESSASVNCGTLSVGPAELRKEAKKQVDYILGDNPKGMSYMVGYGSNYPQKIHHRGSTISSITDHPAHIGCSEGSTYFNSPGPNPNVLIGAVVGGPGKNDEYGDERADYKKSEPTTYINAPFVGVLAYFTANPGTN